MNRHNGQVPPKVQRDMDSMTSDEEESCGQGSITMCTTFTETSTERITAATTTDRGKCARSLDGRGRCDWNTQYWFNSNDHSPASYLT